GPDGARTLACLGELDRCRELPCGVDVFHVHDDENGVGVIAVDVGPGYHEPMSASGCVEFRVAKHVVPSADAGYSLFDQHDSGHEDLLRANGMSTVVDIPTTLVP